MTASLFFPVVFCRGWGRQVLQIRSWTLEPFSETELEQGSPGFYRA